MILSSSFKRKALPYFLLLPAFVLLVIFRITPIFYSFMESLFQTKRGVTSFVGFNNYFDLWNNPDFLTSLWVTLKLNILINPIQIIIAFGMALFIQQKIKFIRFYRLMFFIPIGLSLPLTLAIFKIILDSQSGLLNGILSIFSIPPQPFFDSKNQALGSIIAVASWKGCSFWMIFLWAGLQNISSDLKEAMILDGAKILQRLRYLTIPLMRRTFLFVLVMDLSTNFVLFIPSFLITRGGPDMSTNVLMYEAYKTGVIYGDRHHSMAMIVVLLLSMLMIIGMQFFILREKD